MQHTLENYRSFPTIAWITVICFASLTCYLAFVLKTESSGLENARANTVQAVESDLTRGKIEY